MTDVVFPVMPFADAGRPAMGVSLLKAEAREAGFTATIEYFNLALAEIIGHEIYQQISNTLPPELLVGEWFFADDVFGAAIPDEYEYVQKVLLEVLGPKNEIVEGVIEARKKGRDKYLDECVSKIVEKSPRIVGFTTTFHQTCACLAVARRLKDLPHPPVIVFGGGNCEGEMGHQMIQSFPWIDYVCCGEADISFIKLLEQLLKEAPPAPIPGVLKRGESDVEAKSEAIQDLDALPMPDFDEYYERLRSSPLAGKVDAFLILETSRGCWWGAKHHCTFCGLNGDTMAFRSKSPERAFLEMEYLSSRYNTQRLGCVDNILDMRYVDTLFPKLAESGLELQLFYELKANLRYDQLVKLRRGGLQQIQPGIESFSDQVLSLMDKGCTAFQNIQLLRWCEELGINAAWNLLAGFPGESPSEYDKMAELIPLLTHLNPPCSSSRIRLDRFSPFHARSEQYGFHRMRPSRAYFFVFPLGRRELSRLAYFFDFDYEDGRHPEVYLEPVQREIRRWWEARGTDEDKRPKLDARFDGDTVVVTDTRPAARAPSHELNGIEAKVFAECDVATTLPALARRLDAVGDEVGLRATLADLQKRGLVAESGGHYLSLAVFRDRPPKLAHNRTHAYANSPQTPTSEPLLRLV